MEKYESTFAFKADAGQLTKAMNNISAQADQLATKIGKSNSKMGQLAGGIKDKLSGAMSSVLSKAGGLGKGLAAAFTMGLGPVGLLSAAITAIIGAFEAMTKKSQKFGDAVQRIFSQIGAAISYAMDPSNWGEGFAEGMKEAWEVAGNLADAMDSAGTYAMEWGAKQSDLNAILADSQAVMSDTNATAKERAAAMENARKTAEEYAKGSEKYIDAKRKELEAMVQEVAVGKKLQFSQEEINFLIEKGISDTDALIAMGGKYAEFADGMSDDTQQSMLDIRREIRETERATSQFEKAVNRLGKSENKVEVKTTVAPPPEGSIKAIKDKISSLQKELELTIPMSLDAARIQAEIDELNRQLKGDTGPQSIGVEVPVLLDVTPLNKGLQSVQHDIKKTVDTAKLMSGASQAFGAMSNMVSSLGEESKETTIAVQALAIAEQVAAMAAALHTATEGDSYTLPARLIAAAAAVTSSIIAIQRVSAQGFSAGGIVRGQYESGDRQIIAVNSGEAVLNKQQQSNLFRLLNGAQMGRGGVPVEFRIDGRDLVAVLDAVKTYEGRTL